MKINKIREMSSPDLEKELGELKSELFKLRFSLATNGLDNPMKIKEVKKDIAKIKTVLTQRELNGGKDVEVKLYQPVTWEENGKKYSDKEFVGILKEYREDEIVLQFDEDTMTVPLSNIALIRLSVDF